MNRPIVRHRVLAPLWSTSGNPDRRRRDRRVREPGERYRIHAVTSRFGAGCWTSISTTGSTGRRIVEEHLCADGDAPARSASTEMMAGLTRIPAADRSAWQAAVTAYTANYVAKDTSSSIDGLIAVDRALDVESQVDRYSL